MNTPDTYWDLFLGYTVIWGLILVFVLRLSIEQARLAKRLEQLASQSDSRTGRH